MFNIIFWPMMLFRTAVAVAINLGILATCVLTVTGFLGAQSWLLDLTSHFRVQYLAIQLLAIACLLVFKWRQMTFWLGVLLLCAVTNMVLVLPYWLPTSSTAPSLAGRLKILHMNVFVFNQNYQAVADVIRNTDADVLSLQEVNMQWLQALQQRSAFTRFRYRLVHTDSGNVLYSRLPLRNPRILPITEGPDVTLMGRSVGAVLISETALAGQPITLINLHPSVPVLPHYAEHYQQYLALLKKETQRIHHPVVLIGDLNTTPWSMFYRQLLALGLQDARAHQGPKPTWPSVFPPLFIPIDHVLVSDRFIPLKQRVGPYVGSDHLPVQMELGLLRDRVQHQRERLEPSHL